MGFSLVAKSHHLGPEAALLVPKVSQKGFGTLSVTSSPSRSKMPPAFFFFFRRLSGASTFPFSTFFYFVSSVTDPFLVPLYPSKLSTNRSRGKQVFELILEGSLGAHQVEKARKGILGKRNSRAEKEQGILGRITNN